MNKKVYLDTNVMLYLYSADEIGKRNKAMSLIETSNAIISTQVLNELANVLHKKMQVPYHSIAKVIDEIKETVTIVPISFMTIKKALDIGAQYKFSYFDSLMLASAIEENCALFFSEDLQHEQIINDNLTIKNPF